LGCFGFRLKFGRRGFGVLPSPFLGLLLGLGVRFGLGFGFGLQTGLFLGFLFGLLFSFEFGFFLVRQGVSIGEDASAVLSVLAFSSLADVFWSDAAASLSGAASRGRAERLAHSSPAIMNRAKRPKVERVKKRCRDMVFYPLSTRKDVPVSYGKASGHARPFSLLIERMGRFRAVWRRPSRREAVRARCRLVARGNVRKEEWGRRFDERIDITIL
jgi:hypothetical protein